MMSTFKEFKESILSKLKSKIAIALEVRKQEVAQKMFNETVEIDEGMEAFKAASEVLKAFGGKKPKNLSDLEKFDSEVEKVSKKYKVSSDDIVKVINK